jgi:transposase
MTVKNKRKFTKMQRDEIRRKLAKGKKKIRDIKAYNRLLVLRMYALGKTNKEISEAVGFSVSYVTELVTKYLNEGMESITIDKRTSNNRHMSFEQEAEFLEQFIELADAGQLVTIKEILAKFEEVTGKPSGTSTIYSLLKRHGWRKLQPRPAHLGKASPEEIAASKKLTQKSGGSCWKKIERTSVINTSNIKT